jgi:hypothetical protein
MHLRIFLLTITLICCGATLRAQQKAFRARPVETNAPERGALKQSLKAWQVFSLDGLESASPNTTKTLSFEWGSRQLRFSGQHTPIADQHSHIVEIGPGYRREHPFPQLLQFKGKGIRMIIGKGFILGEYTDQGKKYIVEQLGHFLPGADASKVVVYDATDVIDHRPATCGAEAAAGNHTHELPSLPSVTPRDKATGACRIVEVAVLANSTSYREHGSSVQETASYIASIYSLSEGDYTDAFTDDFRFHISEIVVSTSADTDPWTHTDDIYRNLGNFWNFATGEFKSPNDISSYWFRTQGFNGGVIGLAYMGFTCNNVGDAAIREFGGNAQTMRCLLSHEIGHNFNMPHDAAGSGFIMAPSINGSRQFSPGSKTIFETFVNSNAASCITGCSVDECERTRVNEVQAGMNPDGRSIRAAWSRTPGSQGYVVRWWERGRSEITTRTVDSTTLDFTIPLSCSNSRIYRVEVALVCVNGRPGTFTGIDVANMAVPQIILQGPDVLCPGSSTRLRSSLSTGNQWYLDGIAVQNATGQDLVITEPGSYTVRANGAGGCTYESNELFIVRNLSAERPRLSADGATEFCEGNRVVLSSTAADRYQWIRDGVEIAGEQNRTLSAFSSGAYTVRVETADRCVMISDTIRVVANPVPQPPAVIASRALQLCPGDAVTLQTSATSGIQWIRNNVSIPGAVQPQFTTAEPGSYRVQVTNQFNCSSQSAEQLVSTVPTPSRPQLTSTGVTTVCEGDTVNLQTDATTNIQWLLDGAIIANAAGRRNLYADRPGVYQVRVSNDAGCSTTSDAITVRFNAVPSRPQVEASGQTTFCTGGMVTLQTNAAAGIQWLYNGSVVAGANGPSFVASAGGSYTVTVSNSSGCSSTSTAVTVAVLEPPARPEITAGSATSFCQGGSVQLQTNATTGIQWFRDGAAIANATGRTFLASQAGNYQVRVSNAQGCVSPGSESITVNIFENPARPPLNWNGTEFSTLAGFKTYRWLKDGVEIPGANTNTYRPVSAGNYRTAVTDNNNCPAESENYPLVITGLQDVTIAGASIRCFPNPAREAIQVQVTAASLSRRLTASLVDINGRQIRMQNLAIGLNRFETAQLPAGMYFLMVTDGIERQVIKFVKSR